MLVTLAFLFIHHLTHLMHLSSVRCLSFRACCLMFITLSCRVITFIVQYRFTFSCLYVISAFSSASTTNQSSSSTTVPLSHHTVTSSSSTNTNQQQQQQQHTMAGVHSYLPPYLPLPFSHASVRAPSAQSNASDHSPAPATTCFTLPSSIAGPQSHHLAGPAQSAGPNQSSGPVNSAGPSQQSHPVGLNQLPGHGPNLSSGPGHSAGPNQPGPSELREALALPSRLIQQEQLLLRPGLAPPGTADPCPSPNIVGLGIHRMPFTILEPRSVAISRAEPKLAAGGGGGSGGVGGGEQEVGVSQK